MHQTLGGQGVIKKEQTELVGHLILAGYVFNRKQKTDKILELYGRQAFYYPSIKNKSQHQTEWSMGMNYFVMGHRLKTTGEVSYINSKFESNDLLSGWRYRLQLDISL